MNSLFLNCPVTDSSQLARSSLTILDVYYEDASTLANGYITANRCVEYGSVAGGICGDTVMTTGAGTGVGVLHVPNTPAAFATQWNGGGFGYVLVGLPPQNGSGTTGISRLKGVYEQEP